MQSNLVRVTVDLPEDVADRMDALAQRLHRLGVRPESRSPMTRPAMFRLALHEWMDAQDSSSDYDPTVDPYTDDDDA